MRKPDLTFYFSGLPLIGQYMAYDYQNANNERDMINLVFKWFRESDISTNPVRKTAFHNSASYLYGIVTGRTFESKQFELV